MSSGPGADSVGAAKAVRWTLHSCRASDGGSCGAVMR
jgi:hypothetical protein